jgi:hypothetical protein
MTPCWHRSAFALYKQQDIDTLNLLSKQASLAINTLAAKKANEIKIRHDADAGSHTDSGGHADADD